jgi:hypothetical protein
VARILTTLHFCCSTYTVGPTKPHGLDATRPTRTQCAYQFYTAAELTASLR